ncbi:unnamed protein product [Kluyveromyces dobzhanskii CBS 2104]|uniref:Proline dehydrogenase n=1 Tax=Kluyveromyces dobzhanskii CBS 2104 TaxID=1427455 RepID=A0A0A8L527_9SACH|nr:unnamed protein product [Kluyveromyces dobzhanskii CBS 2104]
MLSLGSRAAIRTAGRNGVRSVPMGLTHRFVSQTNATKSTLATQPTIHDAAPAHLTTPAPDAHLKTLSKSELFSLGMIGMCTINKPILDLVIKLFPFVPLFMVKIFISPLYCGGDTPAEVVETGKRLQERGINNMMLSLTIEDAEGTKNIDINHIVSETISSVHTILKPLLLEQLETAEDINSIPPGYIALKPSALVANPAKVLLNFGKPEWKAQRDDLVSNCSRITQEVFNLNQELLAKYPERKSPFFVSTIDAEKYDLQKAGVYELQRILFSKFNPVSSPLISCVGTWQLYLADSAADLARDYERAKKEGYKLGLKLVRGAYIHSEPNRDVIYATREGTDANYNSVMTSAIKDLLANGEKSYYGHLVVASHNYESQMLATKLLQSQENCAGKANVTLAQLLGMSDNVTHDLLTHHNAKNIIKYVPWGPPVETKDYLLRRLQENGDAVRADNGLPLIKAVLKTALHL